MGSPVVPALANIFLVTTKISFLPPLRNTSNAIECEESYKKTPYNQVSYAKNVTINDTKKLPKKLPKRNIVI